MQYKRILDLDPGVIKAIKENHEKNEELLSKIIINAKQIIVSLLNEYDYYDDTRGEVHDFEILDGSLFIEDDCKGGFTAEYEVLYYSG